MHRKVLALVVALGSAGSLLADDKITFDDHIKPIFREHCLSCHNQNEKKSDLALDTYGATMAGGSSGEVLVAGDWKVRACTPWRLTSSNHTWRPIKTRWPMPS